MLWKNQSAQSDNPVVGGKRTRSVAAGGAKQKVIDSLSTTSEDKTRKYSTVRSSDDDLAVDDDDRYRHLYLVDLEKLGETDYARFGVESDWYEFFEFSSHPRHPPSTTRTMITPSAPLARWKTRGYVCVGGMDRRSFVNEWLDIDLGAGAHACGSFVDPERGYDKSRYVLASTIESWLDYPLCVLVTRDQNVRSGYIVPPTIYSNIVCAHSQLTVADGRLSTFTVPGSGHGEYDAIDIRCAYGLLEIYEREVAAATKLYTSADLDRTDEDLRVMLDDDVGRTTDRVPSGRLFDVSGPSRVGEVYRLCRHSMIMATSIEKIESIVKLLNDMARWMGLDSGAVFVGGIHSENAVAVNEETIGEFKRSQFGIIVVCRMCLVGLDIPMVDTIVIWGNCFPGLFLLNQFIGRGTRAVFWSHPILGKLWVDVIHFCCAEGKNAEADNHDMDDDLETLSNCLRVITADGILSKLAVITEAKGVVVNCGGDKAVKSDKASTRSLTRTELKELLNGSSVEKVLLRPLGNKELQSKIKEAERACQADENDKSKRVWFDALVEEWDRRNAVTSMEVELAN